MSGSKVQNVGCADVDADNDVNRRACAKLWMIILPPSPATVRNALHIINSYVTLNTKRDATTVRRPAWFLQFHLIDEANGRMYCPVAFNIVRSGPFNSSPNTVQKLQK